MVSTYCEPASHLERERKTSGGKHTYKQTNKQTIKGSWNVNTDLSARLLVRGRGHKLRSEQRA